MLPLRAIAAVGLMIWTTSRLVAADADVAKLAAAVKSISPHVVPEAEREALRTMLGRSLREQIASANHRSSEEWGKIKTREDWERFCDAKIAKLRESLGTIPPHPRPLSREGRGEANAAAPRVLVTREMAGEEFKIRNLVFESRPGLVVTANLYVPDPPRESMPGILLSHSHHHPKHEGELQDMGMTWARAGCYVLVPDHLGHGERRQHPFITAADYAGEFQVGRQDYYFRYDTSLQLYLVGESLMGWMVHDLMTGVDVLLAQPGIDPKRIILLGAVAGGGDPAGVTAALDERIACVVPFNFGGPQPENRYPLPEDAETSFNYAGGGSWESTRNLARSAADGFLPWVIVGSASPRHVIHAHEFSWDHERDPVWKRYEKLWGLYEAGDKLSFAHGFGAIQVDNPPGSHCNNIGAAHRKQIHEAFRKWFAIDVKPEDEYRNRRPREELMCLTDEARKELNPKPLYEILAAMADKQLAAARESRRSKPTADRRTLLRESWTRLIGETAPPQHVKVREGSPPIEQVGEITVTRELLETEPGISVPMMTLALSRNDGKRDRSRTLVLGVAPDGIAGIVHRRQGNLADALKFGGLVALVEVRGTGASSPGRERGQQGALTASAATQLMLGQTLLGGQLRDLRAALQHLKRREDVSLKEMIVAGGSGNSPLAEDADFAYPRRINGRPRECDPTGGLLVSLLSLFEDDAEHVIARRGLVSYRSVLDSPFVQVPHECMVPGLLREGDLPDLLAALAPRLVLVEAPVDGRGRLVRPPAAEAASAIAVRAYTAANASINLQFAEAEGDNPEQP